MNVREFFELSAGNWFSQKTSQHLTLKQSVQGKSDLAIEILPSDNAQAIELCQRAGIDPSTIWGGVKYTWKGTRSWDNQSLSPTNCQGETIAIAIPDTSADNTGKLVHATSGTGSAPQVVLYQMGDDDALTLVTHNERISAEERLWFESNNVRFRTTIVTHSSGESIASFYSEIRLAK